MNHNVYSVFGNKIRAKHIFCLSKKSRSVTELIENCELSQSAVSQHLSKLRKAGIVETVKSGQTVVYSLKYKKAAQISSLILSFEQELGL